MNGTTPRFDEDAELLLAEAVRHLDALEAFAATALLDDSHAVLTEAAVGAIVHSVRARRLLSVATHFDLESTAA